MQLTPIQKTLVLRNKKLAYYVARQYAFYNRRRRIEKEDIEQIALLALCKASQNFKPENKTNFSSYAIRVIKNTLLREIPKYITTLTYPQNILIPNGRVSSKARDLFKEGYGCAIEIDSIKDLPDVKSEYIDERLDSKLFNGKAIEKILNKLTPARRYVLSSYYGIGIDEPMSTREMSSLYRITEEAVRNRIFLAKKQFRKLVGKQIDFYI